MYMSRSYNLSMASSIMQSCDAWLTSLMFSKLALCNAVHIITCMSTLFSLVVPFPAMDISVCLLSVSVKQHVLVFIWRMDLAN